MGSRRLSTIVYAVCAAVYLVVGYYLCVRHGFIIGDALSRVSSAQTVLFSRDPHVAAIGFIFTPLTALVQLPAVGFSEIWQPMTELAYSGVIMSALFMAGAAVQVLGIGVDRGLPRPFTLLITVLFAFNPMIVFYGSNGMSEAPFVFFTCWAVRRLIAWATDDDVHHLAAAGVALGLGYLTRYDAVAAIGAAAIFVASVTAFRSTPHLRWRRAALDGGLVAAPGFFAFLGWAATSWLITGQAFAQFSSQYGNSSIMQQSGADTPGQFLPGLEFSFTSTLLLAPTLIPLLVLAGVAGWWRRDWIPLLVPVLIFGAVLAFQAYSYASGSTFGFLRFYILAVPLAATTAILLLPARACTITKRRGKYAPAQTLSPSRHPAPRHRISHAPKWPAFVAAALLLAVTVPSSAWGMSKPHYAPQEYALGAVLAPEPDNVTARKATEHRIAATFSTEREMAQYLDGLDLPEGSILTDTVYGFAVVVASTKPKTFVVPSDQDFTTILNDPAANNVKYLLSVPNTGRGESDALNLRYPTLYETGADIAALALEVPNDGESQPVWRIYRVLESVDD
ncbi:glycosyltransferase family 39 protein [Williamsia sp. 1135]|uniref:ArnT family glycosyltransferase n=1 Tax=Williamsia sp. 1135 TaxID=1889262 RepID=UPI000A10AAD2|nr:glycosyltransferase family 39 protein [Williamsia sp. 1135]ORM26102.1 ABC transporter [Williamsia sp. 1135]